MQEMETGVLILQLKFCSVFVYFVSRKRDATTIKKHAQYTYFITLRYNVYFTPLGYYWLKEIFN
jgi:hypothetical protein